MRYLPLSDHDRKEMLEVVGVSDINELFAEVPKEAKLDGLIKNLPLHAGEMEVERHFNKLSSQSLAADNIPFFCGAGCYKHHIPAAVDHLIQRGEFLTSYTPYQPEISQGTLQYLFEFQTQIALLTGMEIANASMYDGSTACLEAVLMAMRITKRKKAIIAGNLHPHYKEVIETQSKLTGFDAKILPPNPHDITDFTTEITEDAACLVIQNPDFFGNVKDLKKIADKCHEKGILLIVVVTEILSLGLLQSPASMGADIVVGEGQSLGVGLNFGGPHLGVFALRKKYLRQMPGRICGETIDSEGKRSYTLTLSTREQHIRREKATSNICTNAGLCALAFTIHLSLLGEVGFKKLSLLNHQKTIGLVSRLEEISDIEILTKSFFNEVTVKLPVAAEPIIDRLAENGILAGVPASRLYPNIPEMENLLILAATEMVTDDDIEKLAENLERAISC